MRVCRADEGNAAAFTCTYHGWTYGNDGKLVGVPGYKEYYYEELDMEQWGLVPVAQVDTYRGLIFGTFDPLAPSLDEYLGDFKFYLDIAFDRREGGVEIIGGVHKWIMPSNWKFASDNFAGDGYHVPVTHISAVKAGFAGENRRNRPQTVFNGFAAAAGYGHGYAVFTTQLDLERFADDPRYMNYMKEVRDEQEERLGETRTKVAVGNGNIFPNMSLFSGSEGNRTIRVWHPRGPDKIETWSWVFVDKKAPQFMKDFTRLATERQQAGPSSAFEQDDGENWGMCTESSKGVIARNYPLNYQLGLGRERVSEEYPGSLGPAPSEHNQRALYKMWSDLMTGDSWDEIRRQRNGH
jgi:phenylpropionate dioxygenase-like ring-hydroxylating dioxygenase large terminal subunit